jgi:tetratricopeptide (TPR) repeat protein
MNDEITTERMQLQAEYMRVWLQHAPKPPERGDNSYDVFISYRSSDRAWAMALYDALKLAGWEPFLDQYDLIPGSNLETSLTESLQASSSGVILWSSRTKDSEWCKRERQAMTTFKDSRRNSQRPFNYAFAKLDAEPLPLFAQADLYTEFEESPEGPRGVNFLKLMCGMRGVSLAPEAVVLAQKVDQDAQRILVAINGAIEAENPARLREIGTSEEPGILASPGPVLAAAQGLISMGKYEDALEVLKHAYAYFPKSIRVKQLEGLALRRLKRYQDAIDVLSELKAAGHQDPETMGILGAAWDGLYQESGKMLHLRRSRELYRTAFQADPKSYYTGINAATKSLFLGESQEAERLAAGVMPLVKHASDGNDFWAACTLGEVYLLQRDLDFAAAQYQKVVDKHPSKAGDLAGTRQQATRICNALKLSEEEAKKVLAPFELLES